MAALLAEIPKSSEQMAAPVLGECQARPRAVLVHNPVRIGAFEAFESVADEAIEQSALFRSRPETRLYSEQHDAMVRAIMAWGIRVLYLGDILGEARISELAADKPNQVFTRDSLITLPWLPQAYFRSRMKPEQRRPESLIMAEAAERLGLKELFCLPDDVFLEGGDVIPFAREGRRCLLVGYGPRSSPAALDALQEMLLPDHADEIIGIQLASWRMNLDGGFVPVSDDVIVSDTSSILSAELIEKHKRTKIVLWDLLADLGYRIIDTSPEESVYLQSCNCLCLGDRQIVYYDLCGRVASRLVENGIRVHRFPGSELVNGRGGPRCMSRPIYLPVETV